MSSPLHNASPLNPSPEGLRVAPAVGGAKLMSTDELRRRIGELGEWFHNLELHGVRTAPNHFLGDFPNIKWKHISTALPNDLSGATVLDIGCNGGFYSIELKKRGA